MELSLRSIQLHLSTFQADQCLSGCFVLPPFQTEFRLKTSARLPASVGGERAPFCKQFRELAGFFGRQLFRIVVNRIAVEQIRSRLSQLPLPELRFPEFAGEAFV